MDLDSSASGSGGAAAAAPWGTLEELLLVGAISRHGAGDWNVVACELQNRAKLFSVPASYFSPEACKNKFDALNGRYNCNNHRSVGRDKEPENHWPWFEEIRKRRVAQLKRELERHDGSILLLTQKLKRLKTERQIPHKQQDVTAKAQQGSLEKADEDLGAPVCEVKSPKATLDEPAATAMEDEVPIPGHAGKPSNEPGEELQSIKNNHEVGVADEDAGEDMKVDLGETQRDAKPPQKVECVDEMTGEEHVHRKDETQVNTAAQDNMDIGDTLPTAPGDKPIVTAEVEKPVIQVDEKQLSPGGMDAVGEEGPVDSSFVEPCSDEIVEGVSCQPQNASRDKNILDGDKVIEAEGKASAPTSVGDNEVKSGQPAGVEAVEEPAEAGFVQSDEKEGSSSEPSQEARKQNSEEKTDESQVATAVQPEKMETDSPASANDNTAPAAEGSASAHEHEETKDGDSQMEACSQPGGPDDTSPSSRRSQKDDRKTSPAMQSHLEWLKSLCDHKLGPMFMQRQESQEDARYEQVIRRHIDLNLIKARLEEGAYSCSSEFFRDVLLVFTNFIVYYPRTSQEYNAALVLKKLAMEEFEKVSNAQASATEEKPSVSRKRDTTSARRNLEAKPTTTQASVATAAAPAVGPKMDVSVSENSKSKSASVSLGVRSSRGGDEDDTREGGEPEVSGKSKPLRAYGRKNRVKEKQVKESPLETIVKKEAAMAAAKDAKDAAAAVPATPPVAAAAPATPPVAAAATTTTTTSTKGKDKSSSTSKDSKKSSDATGNTSKSKGKTAATAAAATEATAAAAAAAAPPPTTEADLPAATPRGARNKRSAKDFPQRTGKRSRRI